MEHLEETLALWNAALLALLCCCFPSVWGGSTIIEAMNPKIKSGAAAQVHHL